MNRQRIAAKQVCAFLHSIDAEQFRARLQGKFLGLVRIPFILVYQNLTGQDKIFRIEGFAVAVDFVVKMSARGEP